MSYGGDDRGPTLNAVSWTFSILALAVVAFRLISHFRIAKTAGLDDAFVIVAVLVNLARAILLSVAIGEGYGKHMLTLPGENILSSLRLAVILQAVGVWTWSLPKLAVVALLQRVFVPTRRVIIILYALTVGLLIFSLVLTITTFAQCTPLEKNWNRLLPIGSCWEPSVSLDLGYFAGSYSVALDVGYAIYPMLQVSKLQMSRQKKIAVCLSLGLGFVAAITTIYKLTLISETTATTDITWGTAPLEVWNSIEGNLLVIASSLPLVKPFFRAAGQHWSTFSHRWLISGQSSGSAMSRSGPQSRGGRNGMGFDESSKGPVSSSSRPKRDQWHELDDFDEADDISLVQSTKTTKTNERSLV